jgi:hypothetical protein
MKWLMLFIQLHQPPMVIETFDRDGGNGSMNANDCTSTIESVSLVDPDKGSKLRCISEEGYGKSQKIISKLDGWEREMTFEYLDGTGTLGHIIVRKGDNMVQFRPCIGNVAEVPMEKLRPSDLDCSAEPPLHRQ